MKKERGKKQNILKIILLITLFLLILALGYILIFEINSPEKISPTGKAIISKESSSSSSEVTKTNKSSDTQNFFNLSKQNILEKDQSLINKLSAPFLT